MARRTTVRSEPKPSPRTLAARLSGALSGMDDAIGKADAHMMDVHARCLAVVEINRELKLLGADQIARIEDLGEMAGRRFDEESAARAMVGDLLEHIKGRTK